MSLLSGFPREPVTLVKKNGKRFPNIPAIVQPTLILIEDVSVPIEEGDAIVRLLPNGLEEAYTVMDRGFYNGLHGIPSHYQVKVTKDSTPSRSNAGNVTYSIQGSNSRININSVDSSSNLSAARDVFGELRSVTQENVLDGTKRSEILGIIDGLERDVGKPGFIRLYTQLVATVADHMTVFGPLIGLLATLLK